MIAAPTTAEPERNLNRMKCLAVSLLLLFPFLVHAETLPFQLSITGEHVAITKSLELSDVGEGKTEINFDFEDRNGEPYHFDLKYKALPDNRSYPTNLDITLKDGKGNKRGYLFFAINKVAFLKEMETFGLIIDVEGKPVDLKFTFEANKKGTLRVNSLKDERFMQDTLLSKAGFQMIRPVLLPMTAEGERSQTYKLDNHPFNVNYTLKDTESGGVQFQYNLNATDGGNVHLLERIYFHAGSLETLREGMFAGKYFHQEAGTFKLVFYPVLGQTQPLGN